MSKYRKIFLDNMFYLMGERKRSMTRLSIEANVPYTTLSSMLYTSNTAPKVETIEKIANGLGVSVSDILDENMVEKHEANALFKIACADAVKELSGLEKTIKSIKNAVINSESCIEKNNTCKVHIAGVVA